MTRARHLTGCVLLVAAAALVLVACDRPPTLSVVTEAITNGMDDDADPAVVGLRMTGGPVFCSGTLISSRVVLTAAHCILASPTLEVFFGNVPDVDGSAIPSLDARTHPDYNPQGLLNDLGIILLAEDATVSPIDMRILPLTPADIGIPIRIVGFGHTSNMDSKMPRKRAGTTAIAELTDGKFTYHPDPSLTCVGDSGGPGFIQSPDGDWQLAGTTSSGDDMCSSFARDTRVDPHVVEFIQPYIAATLPSVAKLGEVCFYDDNCVSGMCASAAEDPRLRHCTQPCTTVADCPVAGMACTAGACGYTAPTPGEVGTSCDSALECVTQECVAVEGAPICTTSCTADPIDTCPTGFECLVTDGGADGAGLCTPQHDHGCAMGDAGAPQPLFVLMLLVVFCWRARREHCR